MSATPTTPAPGSGDWPADPLPAFERVAYAWLDREVNHGQPLEPAALAHEVSVTPRYAAGLLAVLRAQRARDPGLGELRARRVRDRITEVFVTRELAGGPPLDPATLAAEVGISATIARQWLHTLRTARGSDPRLGSVRGQPASHGSPTPAQLVGLQAAYTDGGRPPAEPAGPEGPLERIEQLYQQREVTRGQRLAAADVARMLGVREGRVRQVLGPLRTQQRRQHEQQLPMTAGRLPLADERGPAAWLAQAACLGLATDRFFPESGEQVKAAEAKQVCAGCGVRAQCRDLAVQAAGGLDRDHGVFGGTLPKERSPLRGTTFPQPSVYRERRDVAEAAHELATRVGLRQAARQLGVHREVLTTAWTQWGMAPPDPKPGWQPTPFLADRAEAERAFRLAERLGSVNAAAAELGTTWPSLRKAFTRHALGMPTPDPAAVGARRAAAARAGRQPTRELDPAFVALNPRLVATLAGRARRGELGERVRRAEQEATLGYRVTTELTAENHWPRVSARAWAVGQRARHARQRARERHPERSRAPGERHTGDRDAADDDAAGLVRRWAERTAHRSRDGDAER